MAITNDVHKNYMTFARSRVLTTCQASTLAINDKTARMQKTSAVFVPLPLKFVFNADAEGTPLLLYVRMKRFPLSGTAEYRCGSDVYNTVPIPRSIRDI